MRTVLKEKVHNLTCKSHKENSTFLRLENPRKHVTPATEKCEIPMR